MNHVDSYSDALALVNTFPIHGKVRDVVGLTIEATGPAMRVGDFCTIQTRVNGEEIPAEVVGFRDDRVLLMSLGESRGIGPGDVVVPTHAPLEVKGSTALLGRVLNGLGVPIDGGPSIDSGDSLSIMASAPGAMSRVRITQPIATGIRAFDSSVTCGMGQRMGIMSGSGVGKSKLIGMIARNTNADVNVIALIGERGREVREFLEGDLGEEGLKRSVVVVATSDEPALMRLNGAYLATAIAEWFRDQGENVMLMMDSVTTVQKYRRYRELRDLRKHQENVEAQRYASAMRSVQMAEQERDTLDVRRVALIRKTRVDTGSMIDVQKQRSLQRYERHLARSIVEQDALIHEREVNAAELHGVMTESMKSRKMMETLADRSRERVADEVRTRERSEIDEIATIQSALRRSSAIGRKK